MEKKVNLKVLEDKVVFDFAGEQIFVNPIIGIENIERIRTEYLKYFIGEDNSFDEPLAEFMMRMTIVLLQTNIDLSQNNETSEIDQLLFGKVFDEISSRIRNYQTLKNLVSLSAQNEIQRRKLDASVAGVITKLLPSLNDFLNKFTPEEIEKLKKESSDMLSEMKESPVSNILKEAKADKKTKKKKEYVN